MVSTHHNNERGQVLVILTIGIVMLLGFAALAIDQGSMQVDRRQAQNAADQAALAGALAKHEGEDCATAALNRAATNGYPDAGDIDVQVNCSYGDGGQYVQVTITSTNPTFLASILGQNELTNSMQAVAHYDPGEVGSTSTFTGGALMALKPGGDSTLYIHGNANLNVLGGGAFVNSDGDQAFTTSSNLTLNTETGIDVVGGGTITGNSHIYTDIRTGKSMSFSGNAHIYGDILQNQSIAAIDYPPPELEIAAPVILTPVCSGTGSISTSGSVVHLTPGNHPARDINGINSVIFDPGNYCFSGDLSFGGNLTVTADNVQIYVASGSEMSIAGIVTFNANGSLFYLESGSFDIGGVTQLDFANTTLYMKSGDLKVTANQNVNMLSDETTIIYLGTGSVKFTGNSRFTTTNTLFYLAEGSIIWTGNTSLTMDAPDTGDYAGLLFYLPSSNTSTLTITGNSNSSLTGSIIAPGANVVLKGNSGTTVANSRIIGYTLDIIANSTTKIDFKEDDNYQIGEEGTPTIELTR